MHRAIRQLTNLVLTGALGALAAACGSTEPSPTATLAGTWDLSTTLQSLTYPVNCRQTCEHATTGPGAGALSGSLTIGGPVGSQSDTMTTYPSSATLNGTDGAPWPPMAVSGSIRLAADTLYKENGFYGGGTGIFLSSGRFAGDSLTGHIRWQTFFGVASRWYDGTFVLRRRK